MEPESTIEALSSRVTDAQQQNVAHFRTNRCFNVDGSWYFSTRTDKVPHGPYLTKDGALQAVGDYIVLMNSFVLK